MSFPLVKVSIWKKHAMHVHHLPHWPRLWVYLCSYRGNRVKWLLRTEAPAVSEQPFSFRCYMPLYNQLIVLISCWRLEPEQRTARKGFITTGYSGGWMCVSALAGSVVGSVLGPSNPQLPQLHTFPPCYIYCFRESNTVLSAPAQTCHLHHRRL